MDENTFSLTEQQINLLDNMARDMGYHGDWCLYVVTDQDPALYGGYIPSMVFRDVQSYFSMNGPLYGDQPFIIGQTLDEARARCRLMNQHLQLNNNIVADILDSAGFETD